MIINNVLKKAFWFFVLLPFAVMAGTAYQDDPVDFYVADNAANDALEEVNFILCMMSNMAMDQMANRGKYKVTLYPDDCEKADTSAADQKAAQPKSAQQQQEKSSSSSTSTTTEAKKGDDGVVEVTRADANAMQKAKIWFLLKGQLQEWAEEMSTAELANMATMGMNTMEPDVQLYIDARVSSGPSETSQFGEFDYKMTYTLASAMDMCPPEATAEEKAMWGCEMPAGGRVGGGRIIASGNEVSYIDFRNGSPPLRTLISYSDGGTKIEGVSVDSKGFCADAYCNDWTEMEVVSAFSLDNGTAAVYCSKALSASLLSFEQEDMSADGMPGKTAVTLPHAPTGLSTDEVCYSLKESDAQKNVYRYGVYNADGTRASLTGESGFPMKATVNDDDGNPVEVFGYADYWYVHVDCEWVNACDQVKYAPAADATVFTREQFATDTGPAMTVTIAQSNQRLTKYTKSYLAVDDLDNLTTLMWIDNASGSWWETQFTALGFPAGNAEYEGSYDKSTGTWAFPKKITWDPQWTETTLETPITFTNAQWVSNMQKTESEGNCHATSSCGDNDWQWTDYRSLWAWSPDTGQGYDIRKEALENPTSSTAAQGILVQNQEELTPSNYPAKLICVFDCPTAATINATAQAAAALTSPDNVVSPYAPTSGQYCKSGASAGQWCSGILDSDKHVYTASGISILDSTTTAMGFSSSVTEEVLGQATFKRYPNDSWEDELRWGVRSGRLLGGATEAAMQADLDKLECERSDNATAVSADNPYRETHPVFNATAKRYCDNAFWEGTGPDTWYELSFGASQWDRKRYAVDQSTSDYVTFARPTTVYYQIPNDATLYGEDADKSARLEFGGFGELWGIPGHVIDTTTGASLGEFFQGEWKENYRYVNRFMIEPYSGVDPVLTVKGSDTTYKVKALGGEQWLALKAAAKDTLTYTKSADNLPAWSNIINVGPTNDEGEANINAIGAVPAAADLINSGDAAVIHGELTMTFTD